VFFNCQFCQEIETMKVRLIMGAEAAYACITHDGGTLDVRLELGQPPHENLFGYANELRRQAADTVKRATLIYDAASLLQEQAKATPSPTKRPKNQPLS
jgi:hypothetical protein